MDVIQNNEVEDIVLQPPTVKTGGYDEIPTRPSICRICFSKLVDIIESIKSLASIKDVVY